MVRLITEVNFKNCMVMKKFLFSICALIALTSCKQDIPSELLSKGMTLNAVVEQTKATIETSEGTGAWTYAFSGEDKIYAGHSSSVFEFSRQEDGSFKSIEAAPSLEAKNWFALKGQAKGNTPGVITFANQEGTLQSAANYYALLGTKEQVTTLQGETIAMKAACAILRVVNHTSDSVALEFLLRDGTTDSFLSDFAVSYVDNKYTLVAASTDELVLGTIPADGSTHYICVPVVSSTAKNVLKDKNSNWEKELSTSLEAGKYYDLVLGTPQTKTIKLLALGNSFSADAVEQELYGIFNGAGQDIIIGDMYIGGCPLSKHADNCTTDAAAYSYRKIVNGVKTTTSSVKLSTALADEDWDYISVQEGAGFHGFYNTTYLSTTHSMEPALTTVINFIKEKSKNKNFKLIYHAPWAAQTGYTGVKFSYYNFDQAVMYKMICDATKQVVEAHPEIDLVANSMDAVQNGRSSYLGDKFCRDGWHMNYTIGRYTVGCLWYEVITGKSVVGNTYHPSTITAYVSTVCQTAAHEAANKPYEVTDLSSRFSASEDPDTPEESKKQVLAKWIFTPERSVADGNVLTWTGQNALGVYRYSNAPGERGYMTANETGSGKLSYVQVDKTAFGGANSGLSVLNVSNGGQPVMCGPWTGDYWLFETTGNYQLAEGSTVRIVYTYNPGSYGAKYWMLEYLDGEEWKLVYDKKSVTIGGKTIEYNIEFTTDQKVVEITKELTANTPDFKLRQICCSPYQVNSKDFTAPNIKCVSRIAGDPANEAKPSPEIDLIL